MSPSAVSEATTGRGAINWVRRKPAQKYEFGQGANLVGILTAVMKATVRDPRTGEPKPATRYTVKDTDTKESVFFFGTVQLDELLQPTDVGHFVSITCVGSDQKAGRNGNAMKLFQVDVSETTAPGWANNGTEITDNDLPESEYFG